MGKIKEWYRSIPIWTTLFAVIVLALLSASVLSGAETEAVNEQYVILQSKYLTITSTEEEGEITYNGVSASEIVEVSFNYENYTEDDWRLYQIYSFTLRFFPAFIYSGCILIFVLLFYFTKLRTPLHLLTKASNQIAGNDLDFQIDYQGQDEMAKLCAAFETMRSALDENNRHMIRMLDERKQLNDAYTHDLRTPIAVLKGYTDMLAKYLPTGRLSQEEVLETIRTMSAQVSRLEQFTDSMNTVQKLEDMPIQKKRVDSQEFLDYLRELADILCQGNGITCEFHGTVDTKHLFLDSAVVIQVYENIMNNAVRFAHKKVMIYCDIAETMFSISVKDDGKGFSSRDLREATHPYYSSDVQKHEYHFGLGLHICHILCGKHGGKLELGNAPAGGASVTASFSTR